MKYFVIGLLVSVGWHIGKVIIYELTDMIKACMRNWTSVSNTKQNHKSITYQRYKGTRMGF